MPRTKKVTSKSKKTTARKAVKKTPVKRRGRLAAIKPKLKVKTQPKTKSAVLKKRVSAKVEPKTIDKNPKVQTELVKKYRNSAKDSGSVGVQIALLTDRINVLVKHLVKHAHDMDSKRGLLTLVGKRRRLLNYVRRKDERLYTKLVKDLKLKR